MLSGLEIALVEGNLIVVGLLWEGRGYLSHVLERRRAKTEKNKINIFEGKKYCRSFSSVYNPILCVVMN